MHVIKRMTLKVFWNDVPESESALKSWFKEVEGAQWKGPADIKKKYGSASILKDSRVVFNICGNKYRLVVRINYTIGIVWIRFVGTHKEYDAINAEAI